MREDTPQPGALAASDPRHRSALVALTFGLSGKVQKEENAPDSFVT